MAELYQWSVPCDFCQKPAKHHCNTCGDVLCDSCKEFHSKSKASKGHSIVPYSEKVELLSNIHIMCGQHTSRQAEYWCGGCDDVACGTCVTTTHSGHVLTEIGEALSCKRKEITVETDRIRKENLQKWEELLQVTKSTGVAYINEVDNVDKLLSDQAEKMHKAVDEILSKKRKKLRETEKENMVNLKNQEETFTQGIQNINTTISEYETLRDQTSIDLLRFKVENMRGKIPAVPNCKNSMAAPTFTSGMISEKSLGDMFGNLTLEGVSQADTSADKDAKQTFLTKDSPVSAALSHFTSSSRQKMPLQENPTPTLMSAPTVIFSFNPGYGLPYIACTGQGLAWVRSLRTAYKKLQLMDRHGTMKDTIDTDFGFNDIAVTPQGDTLFADCTNDCIKSVSQSKVMKTLFKPEDEPFGICCLHSGNIVVTSVVNKTVKLYDINGKKQHEFAGPFRDPCRVAENKINKNIYVCDKNSWQDKSPGKILVYDDNYKHRYEYSGSDSAGSFSPMEVCTDNMGHVLIADMYNDRVHILDKDGHFLQYLLTSVQGLKRPRHIDVDSEGNAWIGEYDGQVKIVRYLNM